MHLLFDAYSNSVRRRGIRANGRHCLEIQSFYAMRWYRLGATLRPWRSTLNASARDCSQYGDCTVPPMSAVTQGRALAAMRDGNGVQGGPIASRASFAR
jgi:hypothetical protein